MCAAKPPTLKFLESSFFFQFIIFATAQFQSPPYSSPITQNPVRFAILYRVTKHYRKRHGFTPSRKKTALFGVLFKFPHRVQMWCAETWILWRRWKLLLIFMTNGRWLRISKKIKSTVYGNEEIKPRIFNTELKNPTFKSG